MTEKNENVSLLSCAVLVINVINILLFKLCISGNTMDNDSLKLFYSCVAIVSFFLPAIARVHRLKNGLRGSIMDIISIILSGFNVCGLIVIFITYGQGWMPPSFLTWLIFRHYNKYFILLGPLGWIISGVLYAVIGNSLNKHNTTAIDNLEAKQVSKEKTEKLVTNTPKKAAYNNQSNNNKSFSTMPSSNENKLFCRKCGKQLALDASFCKWCGCKVVFVNQSFENSANIPEENTSPVSQHENKATTVEEKKASPNYSVFIKSMRDHVLSIVLEFIDEHSDNSDRIVDIFQRVDEYLKKLSEKEIQLLIDKSINPELGALNAIQRFSYASIQPKPASIIVQNAVAQKQDVAFMLYNYINGIKLKKGYISKEVFERNKQLGIQHVTEVS